MLKNSVMLFLSVLLLITYISCSCSKCDDEQKSAIPLEILKSADNFIISYTGEDFFRENIKVDFHGHAIQMNNVAAVERAIRAIR